MALTARDGSAVEPCAVEWLGVACGGRLKLFQSGLWWRCVAAVAAVVVARLMAMMAVTRVDE